MQTPEEFWSEIKFDAEEDLEAFRSGILTERQIEKILRRREQIRKVETGFQLPLFLLMTVPFVIFFGAIFLCALSSSGSRFLTLILILGAFLLVGAGGVFYQIKRARGMIKGLDADLQNKRVTRATGQAKLIYEKGSVQILYLLIGNLTLFAAWLGNFKIDENQTYYAYFLPESKILLSLEKA